MERLSVVDYYREAFEILGEYGSEALTIASLCDRLGITKGSFYHHFGSMAGFVDGLLDYWSAEHTERLAAASRAEPDPTMRMAALLDSAVALPHASEAAVRAWGRSNAEVAEVTAQVDKRRERALTDAAVALGIERPQARLLARVGLDLLIGAQARGAPFDRKRMRQMFDEYKKLVFLDADPELASRLVDATT